MQNGTFSDSNHLPLIVNVHGTRRDAFFCRDSLIDYADLHGCAILAPLFPAALDGPLDQDSYKQLRSTALRSDVVLLDIVDEVRQIWPGIETTRFTLIGSSGGGQFSHRFLYLHPDRLQRVIVGAPGRTTTVGGELWPNGLGDVDHLFDGKQIDIEAVRQVQPILIIVGKDDNEEAVPEYLELKQFVDRVVAEDVIQTEVQVPAMQSRVHVCSELQRNWSEHGIEAELNIVPGVAHSYAGLVPAMVEWLQRTR